MHNLDKIDFELLNLLDQDARMSFAQLARKTKISKQVAKYRVERLENKGIIKGYFPVIDWSRLGLMQFRVYLKLKQVSFEEKKKIIAYLKNNKKTWAVVTFANIWDIGMGVGVKNIMQFHKFWENLLKKQLPNIKEYAISIYSPITQYNRKFISSKNQASKQWVLGGEEKEVFDQIDLNILTSLANNSRKQILEVAKEVGLSAQRTAYRLRRLKNRKIFLASRAIIDFAKLGYNYYKTEIRLKKYNDIEKVMEFCKQQPNIYQVNKVIGGETLEVEFIIENPKKMLVVIDLLEQTFPGLIESTRYLTVLSEEKVVFLPNI